LVTPKDEAASLKLTTTSFSGFSCRPTRGSQQRQTAAPAATNVDSPPRKSNLFVVFRGVPDRYTDEYLTSYINMPATRMRSAVHDKFTRSVRVLCPDAETKNKLINDNFYSFSFQRFRVEDYRQDGPRQCFKCQQFGHTSRDCQASQETCKTCSGPHRHQDCQQKEAPRCSNCQGNHPTTFAGCPEYQKAKESQTHEQLSYAQKTAKPAPTIDTIRMATAMAECFHQVFAPHLAHLDKKDTYEKVGRVVSSVYKRPVSVSQISHFATLF
jgi:hypothetical protein